MSLSERAQKIMEAGMNAYRKLNLRPDPGHTDLRHGLRGYGGWTFSKACVVGAMAHEAKMLHELTEERSDEDYVAKYFDVNDEEVRMMEHGFDSYFSVLNAEYDYNEDEDAMEVMPSADYCNCEECVQIRGERVSIDTAETMRLFEEKVLPVKKQFWQVGWAVAKKATSHYQELDEAEDEAWKMYAERGFAEKDWLDIQLEGYRAMFKEEIDTLLALEPEREPV